LNNVKFLTLACLAAGIAVSSHAQSSPTNSLVRFRLSYGSTFFGDIDVELFNSDKPITVSNFLAYARSGAYENSILHDCLPGYWLRGGAGTVPNPYSSAPFQTITRIPTNAPIVNEFNVGTLRSNVLGTLAMALPGGPDSATASWLFNLGDNTDGVGATNLNTANGGYTVFGKVKSGLNVLQFFNTLSEGQGIQDMTTDFHVNGCAPLYLYPDDANIAFSALPVGFYGYDCIRFSDLFTVQILMLDNPDATRPKVAIAFPAANGSVTTTDVTVSGTASDNVGVSSVQVYLNSEAPRVAIGTNNWSISLTGVAAGTNSLVAEAIDKAGNRSQVARSFFHSLRSPLTLQIVGNGTVTGQANGALLEVGRGYLLVAQPAPGYLFGGWTGTLQRSSASLPFLMQSNMMLTALFVTNRFPAVKGTYNGLFYDNNQVEQQSSGFLSLTVGNLGAYTAKLLMNGKHYRFRGSFAPDGGETNFVFRPETNSLLVRLALELTGGTDRLTGVVTNDQITSIVTNGGWSADLMADRALFNARTNPAPLAGKYTMIIPVDPDSPTGPGGDGFAKVTINPNGAIALGGCLADGTKAVQKVPISKTGYWPLYVPLYRGQGAILSWVFFDTNQPATDFSGLLNWFKQGQLTAKYYPGGFTNEPNIAGSRYTPPSTNRVINVTNASVLFSGGNLTADFANDVTLSLDNKVLNTSSNMLTLTIQKPNGLFTGSVTPPGAASSVPFKGAVLQKQDKGAGFCLGTNLTGRVKFLGE